MGSYADGEDDAAIMAQARKRYGVKGTDLATPLPDGGPGGFMRPRRAYHKVYSNVTISYYKVKDFESYTLPLKARKPCGAGNAWTPTHRLRRA